MGTLNKRREPNAGLLKGYVITKKRLNLEGDFIIPPHFYIDLSEIARSANGVRKAGRVLFKFVFDMNTKPIVVSVILTSKGHFVVYGAPDEYIAGHILKALGKWISKFIAGRGEQ